jgi:Flp pilus assembly pilin Flp
MMAQMRKLIRKESGQGLTEYIIIVALIAIAAIGVVTVFGDNIRALFGASVDALAGNDTANANTKTEGGKANHRNIKNFAQDNGR